VERAPLVEVSQSAVSGCDLLGRRLDASGVLRKCRLFISIGDKVLQWRPRLRVSAESVTSPDGEFADFLRERVTLPEDNRNKLVTALFCSNGKLTVECH
jgi:hypothetical protein